MTVTETIGWEQGDDRVVVLTIDDPQRSANTMTAAFAESLRLTVDRLIERKEEIAGVVLTSGKPTFFAGGDLNDLRDVGPEQAPEVEALTGSIKRDLRRLET